jgi:hypothetical protein
MSTITARDGTELLVLVLFAVLGFAAAVKFRHVPARTA